jgi:predicted DCC family thiol-disulfide oxidoreductase YuxK
LDVQTFLLVEGDNVYVRSEAALEIAKDLGGFRWLRFFRVLPRGVRDWMYATLAKNRYRWFGKRQVCFVPTEEERSRFIDVPSA